ncbi:unnamed protein product, partial [Iphiclides podalirius]
MKGADDADTTGIAPGSRLTDKRPNNLLKPRIPTSTKNTQLSAFAGRLPAFLPNLCPVISGTPTLEGDRR